MKQVLHRKIGGVTKDLSHVIKHFRIVFIQVTQFERGLYRTAIHRKQRIHAGQFQSRLPLQHRIRGRAKCLLQTGQRLPVLAAFGQRQRQKPVQPRQSRLQLARGANLFDRTRIIPRLVVKNAQRRVYLRNARIHLLQLLKGRASLVIPARAHCGLTGAIEPRKP